MSIERLNKAASAAGFAMATPDDEIADAATERAPESVPSRAVVVTDQPGRLMSADAAANLTSWLKGYLPGFGGRQPA